MSWPGLIATFISRRELDGLIATFISRRELDGLNAEVYITSCAGRAWGKREIFPFSSLASYGSKV